MSDDNVEEIQRDILLDAQDRLDALLFGESPYYARVMRELRAAFPEREQQMIVLLALFASKDYKREVDGREKFLADILTPQVGETIH